MSNTDLKRTNVIMIGENNFTGCKIKGNHTYYQNCFVLGVDLKQLTQLTPGEVETLKGVIKRINIQ